MSLLTPPGRRENLASQLLMWQDRNLSNHQVQVLVVIKLPFTRVFPLWFTVLQNCLKPKSWAEQFLSPLPLRSDDFQSLVRLLGEKKCFNKSKPTAAPRSFQMNVGINLSLNRTKITSSDILLFVLSTVLLCWSNSWGQQGVIGTGRSRRGPQSFLALCSYPVDSTSGLRVCFLCD